MESKFINFINKHGKRAGDGFLTDLIDLISEAKGTGTENCHKKISLNPLSVTIDDATSKLMTRLQTKAKLAEKDKKLKAQKAKWNRTYYQKNKQRINKKKVKNKSFIECLFSGSSS